MSSTLTMYAYVCAYKCTSDSNITYYGFNKYLDDKTWNISPQVENLNIKAGRYSVSHCCYLQMCQLWTFAVDLFSFLGEKSLQQYVFLHERK